VSAIPSSRGREVWAEVEPFMLLGRVGAVQSTAQAEKPRVHLVLLPRQEDRS
jgi:hypothetical protein